MGKTVSPGKWEPTNHLVFRKGVLFQKWTRERIVESMANDGKEQWPVRDNVVDEDWREVPSE